MVKKNNSIQYFHPSGISKMVKHINKNFIIIAVNFEARLGIRGLRKENKINKK